jgi:hypothetical protein
MYDDDVRFGITASVANRSFYKVAKFPTRNITAPIVLVYGGQDSLVDINVMLKELPAHTVATEVSHFEHLDFLWGQDVENYVFPHVLSALERYSVMPEDSNPATGASSTRRATETLTETLDMASRLVHATHATQLTGYSPPTYSEDEARDVESASTAHRCDAMSPELTPVPQSAEAPKSPRHPQSTTPPPLGPPSTPPPPLGRSIFSSPSSPTTPIERPPSPLSYAASSQLHRSAPATPTEVLPGVALTYDHPTSSVPIRTRPSRSDSTPSVHSISNGGIAVGSGRPSSAVSTGPVVSEKHSSLVAGPLFSTPTGPAVEQSSARTPPTGPALERNSTRTPPTGPRRGSPPSGPKHSPDSRARRGRGRGSRGRGMVVNGNGNGRGYGYEGGYVEGANGMW